MKKAIGLLIVAMFGFMFVPANYAEESNKYILAKPDNSIKGLPNFAKVSDDLYRGAQPTREGFKRLKEMGIRTIVSLRAFHSDKEMIKGLGFNYVNISFKTWHPEEEDVVKFLREVTKKENQPVFVHCLHGADRTGMMTAIYRIYVQGWPIDEAMKELPNFGFHEVWSNIREYLSKFEKDKIKL